MQIRTLGASLFCVCLAHAAAAGVQLKPLGCYETDIFNDAAAEISAFDPKSQRAFVTNYHAATLDVLDLSNPAAPVLAFQIDVSPYGASANSVAVSKGVVAAAIEANDKQAPGVVAFFDVDGHFLRQIAVGALPDMLAFSPDGKWLLVANEGEPNGAYTVDPEGSVTIIKMNHDPTKINAKDIRTAEFKAFNGKTLDPSIRTFGPGATVAQDLEPEYIAISDDSKTAFVSCQEANALAVIDIEKATVTKLIGLGLKDHDAPGNGLDPSDRDGGIHIANWPVRGVYMPDAIAFFHAPAKPKGSSSRDFVVVANEGDSRDYPGYSEETRVGSMTLDPVAFPDAASLKGNAKLGRLKATTAGGDLDGDGDYDQIWAFGARSFSIRTLDGALVYDSGDSLEQITATALPTEFNSNNDGNGSFDTRSDDKGPEPEGLAVAELWGSVYAFVGLERIGGIAVYDITDPTDVSFVTYVNTRDFAGSAPGGTAGDLGPEGLIVVSAKDSPTENPLLIATSEVSGSTRVFEITAN